MQFGLRSWEYVDDRPLVEVSRSRCCRAFEEGVLMALDAIVKHVLKLKLLFFHMLIWDTVHQRLRGCLNDCCWAPPWSNYLVEGSILLLVAVVWSYYLALRLMLLPKYLTAFRTRSFYEICWCWFNFTSTYPGINMPGCTSLVSLLVFRRRKM